MDPDPHVIDRHRMVDEQIRRRGIQNERVLEAMERVPRELFVPAAHVCEAFEDRALPIAHGQTISQPFVVGAMTAYLDPQPGQRILEIGTGSGYQAAVLAHLAGHVCTIERLSALQEAAQALLLRLGITNVSYLVGDGSLGWPEKAPFDGIIVTAGAPEVPRPLLAQLADPGRIVIPVGPCSDQRLTIIDRHGGRLHEKPAFPCRFVKLLGSEAWPEGELS